MSQHDFDITTTDANTGIAFRAAVNAALQALASSSSGGTAPATPYPYQLWADTTNNLLKQRNGANTAWITIGTLDATNWGLLALAGGTMTGLLTLSGNPTSALHATTKQYTDERTPAGVIFPYAGSTAPTGFLLCYGQAVSRTTYAALFAVIGTTYGAGDGSTTFNVPDLRGRATVGLDNMGGTGAGRLTTWANAIGGTAGAENITLTTNEMPVHGHTATVNDPGHYHTHVGDNAGGNNVGKSAPGNWSGGTNYLTDTKTTGITVTNANSGGGAAHSNVQPSMALNYIIKA